MRIKLLTTLLLVFGVTGWLQGQSYYFNHYPVERGLSNNAVICSLQDRQGFLWFGTKDGLNRFDGYTFKTFRNDDDDPSSIGSNFIYCLYEDPTGVLWVGCDRGLFRYDRTTESFSAARGAPLTEIMDIQMDQGGVLWFTSKLKLYRYEPQNGTLALYKHPRPMPATSLCTDAEGVLWVATASGQVGALYPQADTFQLRMVFEPSTPPRSRWIEKLYNAGDGLLFVGTSKNGAKLLDTRTGRYKDLLLRDGDKRDIFVRDFIHHTGDEYWIATESGIFMYHLQSGQWTNLKKSYNDPYTLSDNAVYTLCKDREGGIWAGTYFGGVDYYPRQFTSFQKYFPHYGAHAISGNAVREMAQDRRGNLWIGTEDAGVNKFEQATGKFTHFKPGQGPASISHHNIHGLLIHGDELWVGTFHHGLDVLDTRNGKVVRHYSAARHGLRSDFVYCLYKTRAGTILAGTNRGLCAYTPAEDRFTAVDELPGAFYTTLFEDRHGTLWAGTYSEGVYYFNPRTGQKGSFRNEKGNRRSLPGNRVNQVMEDRDGALWIATEGGLALLHRDKGTFTNYTTRAGFPTNIIYNVLQDGRSNLWISTSGGLVCFSPDSLKLKTYTKANGLLSDQFNYNSAFKDAGGRMYFGSGKGLISFHPDEFRENTYVPPVYITGFQVQDRELAINKESSPLKQSVSLTSSITLTHDQSSFSIDFAALSYTAPGMTEYAYRMEGLDKDWTFLKTNRKVYFTELAPGTYTFKVKASINSGVWNSLPAVLTIRILPPFWKSKWANGLYLLLLAAAAHFLIDLYHQRTQEKNKRRLAVLELEKEKELYQAKLDFFTNVAHEIRTPLTLIKGPMEKVMQHAEEVPAIHNNLRIMQRNTDRLLDLTTQLLDFRKIERQGSSLAFAEADVREVLRDHYVRFLPAAEGKKIAFNLQAHEALHAWINSEALTKILSNLLNNAIKYARSRVSVHLLPGGGEGYYAIEVRNDGFLVPAEMKEKIFETFYRLKETEKIPGTGIGLALSRSLAELHKGTLELSTAEGEFNVFRLTLPVHPIATPQPVNSTETIV